MNYQKLIISAIINDPDSSGLALEIVSSEMFTGVEREIFKAIEKFNQEGRDFDLYLLSQNLDLEAIGGLTYLTELSQLTFSTFTTKIKEYCFGLKEDFIREKLRQYFNLGIDLMESDTDRILSFAQNGLESIFEMTTATNGGFQHISVITEKAVQNAEARVKAKQEGKSVGIKTGFRSLDAMLHYFKGGDLIVLGGRPGMGKSSVMLHMAKSASLDGVPACIYSLEMSDVSLADRLLFSFADIDINAYKMGDFTEWDKVFNAQGIIQDMPLYIDPTPKVTMAYIRNHARMMQRKGQCGIIFIDYLQLADIDEKGRNRENEVSKASRQAKIIAKELNVPVVLLSQLSRAVEAEKDKRPQLSHLRESGAIEQDADVVMFVYRADYYDIEQIEVYTKYAGFQNVSSKGIMEIIIAKNREGGIGNVAVRHNESLTKLENY